MRDNLERRENIGADLGGLTTPASHARLELAAEIKPLDWQEPLFKGCIGPTLAQISPFAERFFPGGLRLKAPFGEELNAREGDFLARVKAKADWLHHRLHAGARTNWVPGATSDTRLALHRFPNEGEWIHGRDAHSKQEVACAVYGMRFGLQRWLLPYGFVDLAREANRLGVEDIPSFSGMPCATLALYPIRREGKSVSTTGEVRLRTFFTTAAMAGLGTNFDRAMTVREGGEATSFLDFKIREIIRERIVQELRKLEMSAPRRSAEEAQALNAEHALRAALATDRMNFVQAGPHCARPWIEYPVRGASTHLRVHFKAQTPQSVVERTEHGGKHRYGHFVADVNLLGPENEKIHLSRDVRPGKLKVELYRYDEIQALDASPDDGMATS